MIQHRIPEDVDIVLFRDGTEHLEIVLGTPFGVYMARSFGVEFAEVPEIVDRVAVVVRRCRFCAWWEPDVRDA